MGVKLTQADLDRVRHLCYRCYRCGRLLTKIEIARTWRTNEMQSVRTIPLCPCGSRHIVPTNPTLWEELTTPRIWVLWWRCVRGQRAKYRDPEVYQQSRGLFGRKRG